MFFSSFSFSLFFCSLRWCQSSGIGMHRRSGWWRLVVSDLAQRVEAAGDCGRPPVCHRERRQAGGGTRSQVPPPSPRRTHFGSSRTPHTFVRFVLLLSETNGGAGSSSLSALSRALLALSRMLFGRCSALFGRCSLSLIQLCVYVCVFLIFFLLLAVFLSSQMVPVQRDRNASPQWVVAPHRQ